MYEGARLVVEKLAPWLSKEDLQYAHEDIEAGEPLAAIYMAALDARTAPDDVKLGCKALAERILDPDDTVWLGVMKELTPSA